MMRQMWFALFLWVLFLVPSSAVGQDSLAIFRQTVLNHPKDGEAWVKLGYAYLVVDSLTQAEDAFQQGEQYAKSALAYQGRGLVRVKKGVRHARSAFLFFRKALGVDPTFIEAQLHIARTHILLREPDAEGAFRKVMKMDSTYAPVYLELAQWYLDRNYEVYFDELRALYEAYLSLRPDDLEGYYGLALSYTDQHEYKAVLDMVLVVIRKVGIDARWAALMAQAYAARGEPGKAIALFEKYLEMVEDQERAWYDDIRLVAFPDELQIYESLVEDAKDAFLDTFWQKRDPLLVSGGLARRAEHYRRVWYARTYLGKRAYPWDRRGEIYIRYGEPDYRARSGFPNRLPSLAVESIKTKVHADIGYEPPFIEFGTSTSPEGFFAKSGAGNNALKGLDVPEIKPVYPVLSDPSMGHKDVPWEAWYYINIGGGIEITFRDDAINGNFQYPPVPTNFQVLSYHPEIVMREVAVKTPEKYEIPPGVDVLQFYYDVAQFRGDGGQTAVDVYLGVPPMLVSVDSGQGNVTYTMAITRLDGEVVARSQETMRFTIQDTSSIREGTFIPEVVSRTVAPGSYKLALQVTDKNSGKWGVYAQELEVIAFADSLAMSDLEMAFEISMHPKDQQFKKGDVWVIPMPSRHYQRSQNPSVYYEVYNLMRNEFGQTHYRVDYSIQQDVRKGSGLFGSLGAGFKKALLSGKPQVVVGYERQSGATWEPIYLELDVKQVKAGLNQIVVTVTDLVSGQSVSKRGMFQLSE